MSIGTVADIVVCTVCSGTFGTVEESTDHLCLSADEAKIAAFKLCRGRHYWRLIRQPGWTHRQAFFTAETLAYMRVNLIK